MSCHGMSCLARSFVTLTVGALAVGAFTTVAYAQNPFVINQPSIVTDNENSKSAPNGSALKEVDVFGANKELGPKNGGSQQVRYIHTAAPVMLGDTNPNGNNDLRAVWTESEVTADGVWFYYGFFREAAGTGMITIELHKQKSNCYDAQGSVLLNCNPYATRDEGDVLLVWDTQGSANAIIKRTFRRINGVVVLPPCPNPVTVASGTADCELMSQTNVVASFSTDGLRGEAAINLTGEGILAAGECDSIANTIPGTVTGNSDAADYKDAVLKPFPPIRNCGTVTVKKVTTTEDGEGSFPYTLARSDGSDLRLGGPTSITGTLTHDGDMEEHLDLFAGDNYTLAENLPSGSTWALVSIFCGDEDVSDLGEFEVVAGEITACVITNRPKTATVTVIKNVINDNGGTEGPASFTMSLNVSGVDTFPGSAGKQTTLPAGTQYYVTETAVTGYAQVSAVGSCGTLLAPITLQDGDNLTCTITNDDQPAYLVIIKQVINDNGGSKVAANFTLTIGGVDADGGNSVTGVEAPGVTKTLLTVGSYSVTEANSLGYTQSSSADCTGTIALGETKTCTITNDDAKASPGVVTAMSWVLKDQVTLSGLLEGAPTPGTIVFKLYKGTLCTDDGPTATLVHTEAPQNAATNGTYYTQAHYPIDESKVGQYRWVATYSGNDFNDTYGTTCGDEVHTITIP